MKSMMNQVHLEGWVYEHDLSLKESGPKSKNPGTQFISGTLSIATDNACLNVVPVHFTYVTATTNKGNPNATFNTLKGIIDGAIKTVMAAGQDKAGKVRVDTAIGLNEFYTDRNGKEELVVAKRNEGGFVHTCDALNEDEKLRNTFKCDMLITGATRIEANPDRDIPEKVIVKGAIFDFRKALLPVEFTALNPNAMNYYEDLNASQSNPVLTTLWGRQISETVVRKTVEESAFGEAYVRETTNTRKDFVITGGSKEPMVWDDESTMTVSELKEAIAARETHLATVKQRNDEYKASLGATPSIAAPSNDQFNF